MVATGRSNHCENCGSENGICPFIRRSRGTFASRLGKQGRRCDSRIPIIGRNLDGSDFMRTGNAERIGKVEAWRGGRPLALCPEPSECRRDPEKYSSRNAELMFAHCCFGSIANGSRFLRRTIFMLNG